jgi:DNA-binding response OmpR family regulator
MIGENSVGKRVLIVEDDLGVQQLLRLAVDTEGWICDSADDFAHARPLLPRAEVLLLDLHLPDVDGLEVIRLINESHWPGEVIVITGDPAKRRAAERLGVGAFLTKPFDMPDLQRALRSAAQVIDLRAGRDPSAETPEPTAARTRRSRRPTTRS